MQYRKMHKGVRNAQPETLDTKCNKHFIFLSQGKNYILFEILSHNIRLDINIPFNIPIKYKIVFYFKTPFITFPLCIKACVFWCFSDVPPTSK